MFQILHLPCRIISILVPLNQSVPKGSEGLLVQHHTEGLVPLRYHVRQASAHHANTAGSPPSSSVVGLHKTEGFSFFFYLIGRWRSLAEATVRRASTPRSQASRGRNIGSITSVRGGLSRVRSRKPVASLALLELLGFRVDIPWNLPYRAKSHNRVSSSKLRRDQRCYFSTQPHATPRRISSQ